MKPWEIVSEEDKTISGSPKRLVLLRSPVPFEPYMVYALDRAMGHWKLVDRFILPEMDGTESPDWALGRAWSRLAERGLAAGRRQKEKA